jgi:hypothetical protein
LPDAATPNTDIHKEAIAPTPSALAKTPVFRHAGIRTQLTRLLPTSLRYSFATFIRCGEFKIGHVPRRQVSLDTTFGDSKKWAKRLITIWP